MDRKERNFWIFILLLVVIVIFVLVIAGLNLIQRRRMSGAARISFIDDCRYLLQQIAGFFVRG
jgi:uncharacterized membrane protein YhaH (DUF805 family)